ARARSSRPVSISRAPAACHDRGLRFVVLAAIVGCCPTYKTGPLGRPALLHRVEVLADPKLDGRAAGSSGEQAAADYAMAELQRIGLDPHAQGPRNVYAIIKGTSADAIVLGAHLDHLGHGYPGADDDASGVSAVLGIAEELTHVQLKRSVVIALFGGEE